jgi:hypothetical protein
MDEITKTNLNHVNAVADAHETVRAASANLDAAQRASETWTTFSKLLEQRSAFRQALTDGQASKEAIEGLLTRGVPAFNAMTTDRLMEFGALIAAAKGVLEFFTTWEQNQQTALAACEKQIFALAGENGFQVPA